ncbi:MAG: T9SS type A sorting domain-containing protein [Bacteroidetes bacterium]|jgi:hypothetical protein|nr:T9SS type A sorting domain-containing protein [Bacteroidota bacterium]
MSFKKIGSLLLLTLVYSVTGLYGQDINADDIQVMAAPEVGQVCTFEPTDLNTRHFIGHRDVAGKSPSSRATSDFDITFRNDCGGDTFPEETVEAFNFAMSIWETHLQSSVPVRIQATWRALGDNVLGSAGPTLIAQVPSPVGVSNTWYAVAQASAMTGQDIVGQNPDTNFDIVMNINCNFDDWYFGTDANTPPGLIDFVTVVLHEVGHGIGFIGSINGDPELQVAEWGFQSNDGTNFPIIYDRSAEDGQGISLLNESIYPNPSPDLYEAITGQNDGVVFTGTEATLVFGGLPVPLFAPFPWQGGSSYSHLDQQEFTNTDNALMRPQIDRQSATHTPGPVFCGMLSDMGWPLGSNCLELVGVESAISVGSSVLNFGVSNVNSIVTERFDITNLPSAEDPLSGRIVLENPNYTIPESQETFSIDPGTTLEAAVRYNPTNADIHDAELVIFHNSSNQPNPLRIELNGEALEEDRTFALDQNFPNPFNTSTQIEYALTGTFDVRLDVFNTIGQRVATLVDEQQTEGRYPVDFNASGLASGMYLYRIVVDGRVQTRKLMLVK